MFVFKLLALATVFSASCTNARPVKSVHRRALKCKAPTPSATATATPSGSELAATTSAIAKPTVSKSKAESSTPTQAAGSGTTNALFPVSIVGDDSWSTNANEQNYVPLSSSVFQAEAKLSGENNDNYVTFAGKKALKATYPQGSWNPSHEPRGGLSFYAPGPDKVDLTTAKEATFGYSVYFPTGFQFNMGGKLPGLYGGDNDETARGCSGGRRSDTCFSARLMWREKGMGEFYTYLPPYTTPAYAANKKQCDVVPNSDCNPTYGASIGRGLFTFPTGQWTTVTERVRLNDIGKANGEIELFVNGKSKISLKGLILRAHAPGRIRGIQMQTFFGGSTSDWASPKTQDSYFADFSMAITEKL